MATPRSRTTRTIPIILIIDDDMAMTRAVACRLEDAGYECITATTAAEARDSFRTHDVDLVISDLKLPTGSGIELAQTFRQEGAVPIIFLTGFKAGFEHQWQFVPDVSVLEKPFDAAELLDLIDARLRDSSAA